MKQDKTPASHGMIERGRIMEVTEEGYRVTSYDRDGIITPPIQVAGGDAVFTEGDRVYYFVFPDGTGKIICKL